MLCRSPAHCSGGQSLTGNVGDRHPCPQHTCILPGHSQWHHSQTLPGRPLLTRRTSATEGASSLGFL